MYYNKQGKYGLLHDGVIVKIRGWVDKDDLAANESQDIYFNYRFFDRIKQKRKTAFAFHTDFIGYSNSIRELKKLWRSVK